MKNYASSGRSINADNIFSINRIGRNDAVEGGASLTYGAEFSKIKNLISLDPVISYWDKRLKIG